MPRKTEKLFEPPTENSNLCTYKHIVCVKSGWELNHTVEIGSVMGHGKTVYEAQRDANHKAIDVLTKHIRGQDYGENPEYNNEYQLALMELAKYKAFIDDHSITNCIGYGGIFPWGGQPFFGGSRADYMQIDRDENDPKFRAFLEKKRKRGVMYSYSKTGMYGFRIASYAYGINPVDARFRYLTKVAERLALFIRRETDEDGLYDLQEAADKLDNLLMGVKKTMTHYEHASYEALQDILEPEKSWKSAPQFKPSTVIETPS